MPTTPRIIAAHVALMLGLIAGNRLPAQDGRDSRQVRGAAWEQDEYEEKAIQRIVERTLKATDTEGNRWLRELTTAYPGQSFPSPTEESLDKWFDLLAADGREWRRYSCPNRQVAELYDRVTQKLELGPVPSLRREEFLKFAKRYLVPKAPSSDSDKTPPPDRFADADRSFRVLDRDGSGTLEPGEWTSKLRDDLRKADGDGNRRIDLNEYRAHFEGRVADAVEAATKARNAPSATPITTVKTTAGLPAWFKELDKDSDGQIGLYEWRKAGRSIDDFTKMDLNGDGLLTPDEYLRYSRQLAPDVEAAKPVSEPNETKRSKR